jgi:hypothetical protein
MDVELYVYDLSQVSTRHNKAVSGRPTLETRRCSCKNTQEY